MRQLEHFPNLVAMFFARADGERRRALPLGEDGRRVARDQLARGGGAGRAGSPRRCSGSGWRAATG